MKNQIIHFLKPARKYVFACLLGSAAFVMSCETSPDEVLPQETLHEESVVKTQGQDEKALLNQELARLRAAVAPYHNFEHAMADGYTVKVTDYVSQMGFHYLKPALLDGQFELERPEILIYAPAPNGGLRFVGVEYATGIPDMENPPPAPEGFTGDADIWAINRGFEIWTLHVWVGLNNPDGIFTAHNPRLP